MAGSDLAPLFNIGPRIAGQILGLPYSQYRPSGTTAAIVSGNLRGTIPVWVTADAAGMGTRPFVPTKPIAYGMTDPDNIAVGDYLVGGYGTFFVGSLDGPMPTQLVRCNQTVTVKRPGGPAVGSSYYGGMDVADVVTLIASWPASVIQGTKGETGETKLPGDTRLAWVAIMLPSVSGVEILPGDWIATAQTTPMIYTVSSCELTPIGWRISASTAVA